MKRENSPLAYPGWWHRERKGEFSKQEQGWRSCAVQRLSCCWPYPGWSLSRAEQWLRHRKSLGPFCRTDCVTPHISRHRLPQNLCNLPWSNPPPVQRTCHLSDRLALDPTFGLSWLPACQRI